MPMLTTFRIRLAGVPPPGAAAHGVRERGHPVEHRVDLGHDVLPVHHDRGAARRAQRDVEHGAVLGDVDLLSPEHRVDLLAEPGLLRQLEEQPQRLVGDPVLGVVEEDPRGLERHPLAAARVGREELAQVQVLHLRVVEGERGPGLPEAEGRGGHGAILRAAQPAFATWAVFAAIPARSSFHDFTNAFAPSSWSLAASASTSTPARTKRMMTSSQSPPSSGRGGPSFPWSANAFSVPSGIVFTVRGDASAST